MTFELLCGSVNGMLDHDGAIFRESANLQLRAYAIVILLNDFLSRVINNFIVMNLPLIPSPFPIFTCSQPHDRWIIIHVLKPLSAC